ncbi:nucleoside 2-deoxyribosyltransferase [Amorphus sp. MBR-141]
MHFLTYLAGPITGLSYEGATDWRSYASERLHKQSKGWIFPLSPLRAKDYLAGERSIADHYEQHVLSSQRGIYHRDLFDCRRSDLVLANLIGAKRVSIGTVMEIAWAAGQGTPVVLAMEDGNPHEHSMLREAAGWRVSTLADAVDVACSVLCPGPLKVAA